MKILRDKQESSFQWIADREANIVKDYNIYMTEAHPDHDKLQVNHAIPSKFLINKEGEIVWALIGSKKDRPSIEQILEAIEKNI